MYRALCKKVDKVIRNIPKPLDINGRLVVMRSKSSLKRWIAIGEQSFWRWNLVKSCIMWPAYGRTIASSQCWPTEFGYEMSHYEMLGCRVQWSGTARFTIDTASLQILLFEMISHHSLFLTRGNLLKETWVHQQSQTHCALWMFIALE